MGSPPSTAAWVALATLTALFGASYLVEQAWRRQREGTDADGPKAMPEWVIAAVIAVSVCPAAIAILTSAPWPTVLWWLLVAILASSVLLAVVGSAVVMAVNWPRWRAELTTEEQPTVYLVVGLSATSVALLPAVSITLSLATGDVRLAIAAALAAAFSLWRVALEIVRRSPVSTPS